MKTFKHSAAQGEITITRIEALPLGVVPVEPVNGEFIIGHSETGHHHVMTAERVRVFQDKNAPVGMTILYAILDGGNVLEHKRPFDTHESIKHDPGIYEFRSGREFDHYAKDARKQAD